MISEKRLEIRHKKSLCFLADICDFMEAQIAKWLECREDAREPRPLSAGASQFVGWDYRAPGRPSRSDGPGALVGYQKSVADSTIAAFLCPEICASELHVHQLPR